MMINPDVALALFDYRQGELVKQGGHVPAVLPPSRVTRHGRHHNRQGVALLLGLPGPSSEWAPTRAEANLSLGLTVKRSRSLMGTLSGAAGGTPAVPAGTLLQPAHLPGQGLRSDTQKAGL